MESTEGIEGTEGTKGTKDRLMGCFLLNYFCLVDLFLSNRVNDQRILCIA